MISRRKFVTHGVAVGAACWVAPTIVSVPVAWATPPHSVPPGGVKKPPAKPQMGGPIATGIPAELPFTGEELKKEAVLGAAVLGAGAVVAGLAHTPKRDVS